MNRLLILSGKYKGLSLELEPGVNRIGRSAQNQVILNESTISSAHCEAELQGGVLSLRDLGSTNGTFVDGKGVREAQVQPGQVFKLGGVEMSFETAPVNISVPEVDFAEAVAPEFLPDGSVPCRNHHSTPADYRCNQCGRSFCYACVHKVALVKGPAHILCPDCSGSCTPLFATETLRRKRSILGRVWDALKMARTTKRIR